MCAIAGRLFLVFLLACDWAADPSLLAPAVRGLAAPFASTICFCHSIVHRTDLRRACAAARDAAPRRPAPETAPPHMLSPVTGPIPICSLAACVPFLSPPLRC